MALSQDQLLALIILSRNVQWRYELDNYEQEVLLQLQQAVRRAETEILQRLDAYAASLPDWAEDRALGLLDEMSDLTLGIQGLLYNNILDLASIAGAASFLTHNDIVSFGGRVPNFNAVALTSNQLRSILVETPVGGQLLNEWLATNYLTHIEEIRNQVVTGLLKGDDYRQFANRLEDAFGFARSEAVTLARTYVQTVNVHAQESTYQANADIIKGVRWTATLEPGYKKTGRGTCLRCAVLDGQTFPLNGPKPPAPLHPNCRCLYLPITVTWREMGIDADEMADPYRPYTIRPNKNIGTGGGRTILEHGFHDGDYSSWLETRSSKFKQDLLGPGRFQMIQSGQTTFSDLVDRKTGRLKRLAEL